MGEQALGNNRDHLGHSCGFSNGCSNIAQFRSRDSLVRRNSGWLNCHCFASSPISIKAPGNRSRDCLCSRRKLSNSGNCFDLPIFERLDLGHVAISRNLFHRTSCLGCPCYRRNLSPSYLQAFQGPEVSCSFFQRVCRWNSLPLLF